MICTLTKQQNSRFEPMFNFCFWRGKDAFGMWTEFIWLRIGTCGEIFGHRMEPSGSIKCGEFLDWLGV
jgi:hypothetical protein